MPDACVYVHVGVVGGWWCRTVAAEGEIQQRRQCGCWTSWRCLGEALEA